MTSRNIAFGDSCTICSTAYTGDTSLDLPTLALLVPWSGSVLVDPMEPARMRWFALPSPAYWWKVRGTHALGRGANSAIPPGGRHQLHGPHWRVPPNTRRWFTDASFLHAARCRATTNAQ